MAAAIDRTFKLEDWHNFGRDYDRTLVSWHANFKTAWPEFSDQFGDRFYRLWTYYLLMMAGVFRARALDLWQLVLTPKGLEHGCLRPLY